ncbi:MAG: hypothetical protein C0467_16275 [Planctomycetaceae bacterium]|nr:hypothetical protein [Planctomycetaceae bacterium]
MPNDAKLGLLVGVVGVIVVAVMSANRSPQTEVAANVPSTLQKNSSAATAKPAVNLVVDANLKRIPELHPVPAVLPVELPSTPVVRTKREPVATPTSRTRADDDIEP